MPLETNNNKFICGVAFLGPVWCKPHQTLPLVPSVSWCRYEVELKVLRYSAFTRAGFVVRATEAFHLNSSEPPPRLTRTVMMKTVKAFVIFGSFFWNSWQHLGPLTRLKVQTHTRFCSDVSNDASRAGDNLLHIWTPAGSVAWDVVVGDAPGTVLHQPWSSRQETIPQRRPLCRFCAQTT